MARLSAFSWPWLWSAISVPLRSPSQANRGAPSAAVTRTLLQDKFAAEFVADDHLDRLVAQLLGQGRAALLLHPNLRNSVQPRHLQLAQRVGRDNLARTRRRRAHA